MKRTIRLVSDLHTEFMKNPAASLSKLVSTWKADKREICVLAGDIGSPLTRQGRTSRVYYDTLKFFRERYDRVILVPGNHEYYKCRRLGIEISKIDNVLDTMCKKLDVKFLQKGTTTIDDIKFIGCTLWSDITYSGFLCMNDSRNVFTTHKGYADIYKDHVSWLTEVLTDTYDPCVVVTHHLPSYRMIHPRYRTEDNSLNSAFASDLDNLIELNPQIRYWLSGHTHEQITKYIGEATVTTNPLGYPGENRVTEMNTDGLIL